LTGKESASIKIRATEEIVAARAAQLAFLNVEFVAAARASAPMFTPDLKRSGSLNRSGVWQRARMFVLVGGHSKLFV